MNRVNNNNNLYVVEEALKNGQNEIVIRESGIIFEQVFKKMYRELLANLPLPERKLLIEAEEEIGKKEKGIERFTFGEIVGLDRKTHLLQKWAKYKGTNMGLLNSSNLASIVELRNKCVHLEDNGSANNVCSNIEANLVLSYLKNLLAVIGEMDVHDNLQIIPNMTGNHTHDNNSINCKTIEHDDIFKFQSVNDIYPQIIKIIDNYVQMKQRVHIKNIGLDLETVWPRLIVPILNDKTWRNITYEGLIINPNGERINQYCDMYISPVTAKQIQNKFISAKTKYKEILLDKEISIDIKEYSELPIIHGFLINETHLLYSFTEFDGDELTGGFGTYVYIDKSKDDKDMSFFVDAFDSWFSFLYYK